MKVDGAIRSLLQGISQQPSRDRLPGQATIQDNMQSDPVTGLTRRPPTDLVERLVTSSTNVRGWHSFSTKTGNKFLACVRDGLVKVSDLNGVQKVVHEIGSAYDYLIGSGTIAFSTVQDKTYVLNKNKVPAMLATTATYCNRGTSAYSKPRAIIQVLGGQYNMATTIYMNGTRIASYQPPDGSVNTDADKVQTTFIAAKLATNLVTTVNTTGARNEINYGTSALAGADWSVVRKDDLLLITDLDPTHANDAVVFTMTVSDDRGNINVKCCTSSVPDTADLPRYAPEGYVIRIATETDPEEDLWVKFDAEGVATPGNGFGQPGAWIECVAPDTKYIINQTTMPCVLEYDSVNDDFDFKYVDWADRQVGTTTSNPDPSFIGNKINDIATFQSRLVLLAGPYAVLSRTNREEDFWLGSASALVDDDAIDISSTAVEASIMQAAIPHNRDLVIFSTRGQFVIFGRNALTPTNASLVLTTAFEADLLAKPVPAGRNIFFGTTFGRFAGVREFYTEGGTDINDTRPITHHVKQFIEGRARKFTASPNYELLGVTTGTSNFYLYQYIWADNEKVQSSWSRWTLNEPIAYSFFDDEILYFVIKREATNEYFLHRMSLDVIDSAGLSFPIMLDSRFDVTGVNTSFVLPFDSLYDRGLVAVQGAGCPNPGMRVLIENISYVVEVGYVATLAADMLGGDIVVGIPYLSKYAPTMPLPKDQDGVVMSTAKLHVRHFIATVQDTGYIAGQTYTDYGNGEIVEFEGRVIGAPSNIIGAPALYNGQVTLPFREDVNNGSYVAFYSRSFYPMTLLDIEWLGQYSKRGQRMSINSKG